MKIDQIKQQISICMQHANELHARSTSRIIEIGDSYSLFAELKRLISVADAIEMAELDGAIKELFVPYDGCYKINITSVVSIGTVLSILSNKYKSISNSYKIFISHAHGDKDIIDKFTEKILRLGCGVELSDIFCTSIESMGIKTGEDLRNRIKINMTQSDYIFLMISKSYKKSTMCLNEMGASWVLGKKVKPFLFPPLKYSEIWLSEVLKNSYVNDGVVLDSLRDELIKEYDLKTSATSDWNKQKDDFTAYMNQLENKKMPWEK